MKLKIIQIGEPVLRQPARLFTVEEILSPATQQLIEWMRETMQDAPGVGLAAPQIGESLQLAVIEDQPQDIAPEILAERERVPIPFHVIINPRLTVIEDRAVEFFEGCLSVTGFTALVLRARSVRVDCLNEKGEQVVINAQGWYGRILQHEIDHLNGFIDVDRMLSKSFMTSENYDRYYKGKPISEVKAG